MTLPHPDEVGQADSPPPRADGPPAVSLLDAIHSHAADRVRSEIASRGRVFQIERRSDLARQRQREEEPRPATPYVGTLGHQLYIATRGIPHNDFERSVIEEINSVREKVARADREQRRSRRRVRLFADLAALVEQHPDLMRALLEALLVGGDAA